MLILGEHKVELARMKPKLKMKSKAVGQRNY